MNKDTHLIYEAYVHEEGLKDVIKKASAAAAIGLGSATGDWNPMVTNMNAAEDKLSIEKPIGFIDPKQDRDFITFVKQAENSVKKGFEKGRWYPHPSYEGGTDTIAYGHKLGKVERYPNGLSDAEAENLLKRDLMNAENKVKTRIGEKEYNKLDNKRKQMLIDIAFNVRDFSLSSTFPKFIAGVIADDIDVMKKEYTRKDLPERNRLFFDLFLKDRQFKKPEEGKKDSEETTVIVKQGDTFYKIANIMKVNVNDLMKANPGVDPKKLQTGQELNLP
jgi:LysM repeat protein